MPYMQSLSLNLFDSHFSAPKNVLGKDFLYAFCVIKGNLCIYSDHLKTG